VLYYVGRRPVWVRLGRVDHLAGACILRPVLLRKRTHFGPVGSGRPWPIAEMELLNL
jgi:hypothetical protein